jgi:DNA-binding phage protein
VNIIHATKTQRGGDKVNEIIVERLKAAIEDSGMTMVAIAEKAGMKRETLYNRLALKGEFTASEIVGLCTALKLDKKQRDFIFCL